MLFPLSPLSEQQEDGKGVYSGCPLATLLVAVAKYLAKASMRGKCLF